MSGVTGPLLVGEAVIYDSSSQGPIHATVVAGPHPDGTYDLNCKQHVPTSRMARASPPTQPVLAGAGGPAAVDPQPFAVGDEVVYHSASQGDVQAKVVAGPHPDGSYDLDCKSRVPQARISRGSGRPTLPPQSLPQTQPQMQPQMQPPTPAGEPCFLRGEDGEWAPAQMLRFNPGDGTYDLDCKERAHPQSVRLIREGDAVEYHSASSGQWIPAKVLRRGKAAGTFDLDCKEGVGLARMRPAADGSPARTPDTQPMVRGSNPGSTAPVLKLDRALEDHARLSLQEPPGSQASVQRVVMDVEGFYPGQRPSNQSPPPTCLKADVGEQRLAIMAMEQAIMRRDPEALHEAIHRVTSMGIAGPDVTRAVEMLRAMGGRLQRRPLPSAAAGSAQQPPMADLVAVANRLQEEEACDEPGLMTSLFGPAPLDEGPGLLTQLLGPKPSDESGFLSRFFGGEEAAFVSRMLGTDTCEDMSMLQDPRYGEAPSTNPQLGPGAAATCHRGGQPGTAPQLGPGRAGESPMTNPQLGPGYAPGSVGEVSPVAMSGPPAPPTQLCLGPDGPGGDRADRFGGPPTQPQLGHGHAAGPAPTNPQLGCGPPGQAPTTNPQLGHGVAGQAPTTNPQLGHGAAGQAPATRPQLGHAPPPAAPQGGHCPAPRPKAPAASSRPQPGSGCEPGGAPATNPRLGLGHAPGMAGAALPTEPQMHAGPWAQQPQQSSYGGRARASDPIM